MAADPSSPPPTGGPTLAVDVTLAIGGADFPGGAARALRLESAARVVGVYGPSGAGKSTLLRVLAGLERRAAGHVRALGETWLGPGLFVPPWRRGVGWVPQDAALFPHLTVRENLAYAAAGADGVGGIAAWLGVEALLERAPRNLSGGERQRVALGRALLARPRLLLLDEPFSALDRRLRERLAAELAERCAAAGLPVVLVTHDEANLRVFAAERWELGEAGLERQSEAPPRTAGEDRVGGAPR